MAVRRRAVCVAGLSFGLPAGPLLAAEEFVLRIETIQSEPFGRAGPPGPGGLMYDIGNLIAQRAGLAVRNRVVPYARTVLSLQDGVSDVVLRFSNDELKAVAQQVAPVLTLPTVVVSRRDAPLRRLEDLAHLSLAVPRSFPMPEELVSLAGLRVQAVNNNEHSIQMLMGRRVDAAYGSNLGLFGAARGLGLRMEEFARPLLVERQTFWLHLSRRSATPELIDRLTKAVESLQRDGSIARLYQRALLEFGDDRMPA
ncbi:ABC-type amino acid transport substrate-binding protein [Pelomonas saccharophila]|uniref:ABC-type amino acid transport substrate-binding protein n=1 Tax=Roseateles saccharophilus TaxID=304 RepID=A0ABU1YJ49_ROSSA|nr:transporter substrate-binding domain-containing protein [Roseateles saccharophilus]MDR7268738.1 ABC-type amino acid transport substrate-binding protein [Roseateles saccharophilus]